MSSDTFSLREESLDDHTHVIEVRGALEGSTSPSLTASVTRAVDRGATRIVIDLAETTFLDSSAIASLMMAARVLGLPGRALAVVASRHPQPLGRIDFTGTGQVLHVCKTRNEALDLLDVRKPTPTEPHAHAVRFWLFVNAKSPNARHAIAELAELRRRHLPDAYIEIIDINERPDLAERERLLGSPTLIRTTPRPVRRIVGDLSDHDRVLHALELDAARGTPA